jgi:hypothetical protein
MSVPCALSTMVWRSRPDHWNLTVCLKATFALENELESHPASQQDCSHEDVPYDDIPRASLYSPSDFVLHKPHVDLLLVGSAFAPGGTPVKSLSVRFTVGAWSKALRITGDREWTPGGRVSEPRPFSRMALRYERAARRGENVVGPASGDRSRDPPNIDVEGAAQTPGFGPIARSWRLHMHPLPPSVVLWTQSLRGASGQAATTTGVVPRGPASTAPEGFDFGFFNAAPHDQQIQALAPSTPVVLENLHPRFPRLSFRLPPIAPSVFLIDPRTGVYGDVTVRCDTVWIDPERDVYVLSWRGARTIPPPEEHEIGRLVYGFHAPGEQPRGEEVDPVVTANRRPAVNRAPAHLAGTALLSPEIIAHAMLPFKVARPPAHLAGTSVISPQLLQRAVLPFQPAGTPSGKPLASTAVSLLDSEPPAMNAPFALAEPHSTPLAASEEIPGAPWASGPAPVVHQPGADLRTTMALDPLRTPPGAPPTALAPCPVIPPPPAVAELPRSEQPPAAPPAPESPPPALACGSMPNSSSPPASLWREDPPTEPPATPKAPPPAAPPAPTVRKNIYGDF